MRRYRLIFSLIIIFSISSSAGANYTFESNLSLGNESADVYNLQKLLNQDSRTRVSESGIGSLGNETYYFGELTKNAVIRFQELYREEILSPVSLFSGTGFVGPSTRAKLSNLTKSAPEISVKNNQSENVLVNNPSLDFGSFAFPKDGIPYLMSVSSQEVSVGEQVKIIGANFSNDGNKILLNGKEILTGLKSSAGNSAISFILPSEIKIGTYRISVKTSGNKTTAQALVFIVRDITKVRPIVKDVMPKHITYGGEVKIIGENFSKTDNTLITSYGVVSNLESKDGKTIVFNAEPFPDTLGIHSDYLSNTPENIDWDIFFNVASEGGLSKEQSSFVIKF